MPNAAPGVIVRFAAAIWALSGRRRALAAFATGALSVLAFAPFHAFPVLFVTLPVLVWLIDASKDWKDAAWVGWCAGFGYFLFNLFWIGEAFLVEADKFAWLLPFAVTLLPAGMALFWALGAAVSRTFWRRDTSRLLLFALVFGLTEWLRGHVFTGLPWNVLGYALTWPLELMQSAAVFGVYALGFAAILIFAAPLVILAHAPEKDERRALGLAVSAALVPLALFWIYGAGRLAGPVSDVPGVRLRLVQPSVPQREKWLPERQRDIFEDHLQLSATAPDGRRDELKGITHVVWPEAAMPFLPLEQPIALKAIADLLPPGTTLISGAIRRERGAENVQRGYNSLMAFDHEGRLAATYDKVHLVPFGEYLPFEPVLAALGLTKLTHGLGAFDSGPWPRPLLTIPGLPATGGLICYEVLFPGEVIDDAHRPQVLVNLTNDGWFGDTTGPRQHFYQTRVRAVEEGVPVVRVANNGISGLIDPMGRVRARIDLNIHGVADAALPAALPPPPYARWRDAGFWIFALLLAGGLALQRRKHSQE